MMGLEHLCILSVLCSIAFAAIAPSTAGSMFWLEYSSPPGSCTINRQLIGQTTSSVIVTTGYINQFEVDDTYVYWGEMWTIRRAFHNGSQNMQLVSTNKTKYGYGLIYNFIRYNDLLIYQTQANYDLYALNTRTLDVEDLGNFRYNGNGGMNGALAVRPIQNANYPVQIFWGIDQGESPTQGGCQVSWIPKSNQSPQKVFCGNAFPRGLAITSDGSMMLTGIQGFSYVPALVNISNGQIVHTFTMPSGQTLGSVRIAGQTAYVIASKAIYTLSLAKEDFGTWTLVQDKFKLLIPAYIRVSLNTQPLELYKITPTNGSTAGNTTLYALASGLTGPAPSCLFGGVIRVPGVLLTDQLMSCQTPASPVAGVSNVQVSNDGVNWSNALQFTYTTGKSGASADDARLAKLSAFARVQ